MFLGKEKRKAGDVYLSEFGLRIKNIKAATLYYYNLGLRKHYDYTNAMLCNSLFSNYMREHGGLKAHNEQSTRDMICLDFGFGTRSYEEELSHLNKLKQTELNDDGKIDGHIAELEKNREKYNKLKKEELREIIYRDGIDVKYPDETIHYKMLYRNPSKAKTGQVMFINAELYDVAIDWLTMGLSKKMPKENAKIVEISAYAPLSTSTIEASFTLPLDNVLILEDQDSFFKTIADVVSDERVEFEPGKFRSRCVLSQKEVEVKNTIWDGMALIDSEICDENINGMCLLRNHFFKACAFKTRIQLFIKDWCERTGNDYETYEITDMFGIKHKAKDIRLITTDNAIKWKKFKDLMGGTPEAAYLYWKEKVEENGNIWGIVKTDHESKLGSVQQMSYQMINTLPCSEDDVAEIANTSIEYVEKIRDDDKEFEKYLRKNSNLINNYEMIADLQSKYPTITESDWYTSEKRTIINNYIRRLKKGKIIVNGDNMTVCGNPYALLLYTVGEDWESDPTLKQEDGVIQCFSKRFDYEEYLCAFRSPQNSSNNVCYLHNKYSIEMEKYFEFSDNICAVNCIHTDIQARANGMDFDSDFMFITNNPTLVSCAKECYRDYPTVVNALKESGITYENTLEAYAKMDNNLAKAQLDIGESSNLAQLALSYFWTEKAKPEEKQNKEKLKDLYDNFVILAVLAQIAIDSCKREYAVKVRDEINRIRAMSCMKHDNPFPEFMENVKEVKLTKNGKERKYEDVKKEKQTIKKKVGYEYVCPMNTLNKLLNKIQGISLVDKIDISYFLKTESGSLVNEKQTTKLLELISDYDKYSISFFNKEREEQDFDEIIDETKKVINELKKMKISKRTMNYIIHAAMGDDNYTDKNNSKYKIYKKNRRKILNFIYASNPQEFLKHFQNVRRINCIDCGKEVIVKAKRYNTYRCEECQNLQNKKIAAESMRRKRNMLNRKLLDN